MARTILIWCALGLAIALPLIVAAQSPLLAWREPIYIAAGFAGVVGLALMLVQPLLASGALPGLSLRAGRRLHRVIGAALVAAVVLHVAGLWITSPPDVIDALTFTSPTPFSAWGVIAMWAVFGAAILAVLRRGMALRTWRKAHSGLAVVIVAGTVLHALLIEGTMGVATKTALCTLVVAALMRALVRLRAFGRPSG
ncbi:ferric reductase-like transmembrane domain-containing protein [uncultured Jannaschia sp.]|uniref:ferric reductase-like transmembrane domain-containing protein n=1 Tax=uncultured Jannaschia sp. TaxID=293347 RepID=UPI002627C71B|nr:ferric reductase-like transmembrane domain-containing protein [uncultured Jannaschia sp.]